VDDFPAIVAGGFADRADGVRRGHHQLGYIDPLSGAFARQGDASLRHFAHLLDKINAEGGDGASITISTCSR
jgi:ABC-type branched-subunit amino acid transport system substrate-binding protein